MYYRERCPICATKITKERKHNGTMTLIEVKCKCGFINERFQIVDNKSNMYKKGGSIQNVTTTIERTTDSSIQ